MCAAQALCRHLYLLKRGRSSKSSRTSQPPKPAPAHTDTSWLPLESVQVSSTVGGYTFAAPIHASNPRLGLSRVLGAAGGAPLQNVAAHVYRYLRRAFMLWPAGQAKESLGEVIDLWLTVCLPWQKQDSHARCEAHSHATDLHVLSAFTALYTPHELHGGYTSACVQRSLDIVATINR